MAMKGQRWFGDFDFPMDSRSRWRIGALCLTVERAFGEWRVWYQQEPAAVDGPVSFQADVAAPEEPAARYVVDDRSPRLSLQPLLPDRSVVARPASPLFVPAGESARLYVSIPLWVRLEVGEPRKRLIEIPTFRLSDTWFGPNTREGEYCYALRSRCRLQLHSEQLQPYRAVAPLVIRNHYHEPLALESVNVPVRQLSLFVGPDGLFWTNELAQERSEDGDIAALRFASGPPGEARDAQPVAGPRDTPARPVAIRAFSALFQ